MKKRRAEEKMDKKKKKDEDVLLLKDLAPRKDVKGGGRKMPFGQPIDLTNDTSSERGKS